MGKRLVFVVGEFVGPLGIKYIGDCSKPTYQRRCVFECPLCFSSFECSLPNVRHGKVKSCGCAQAIAATKHGLSKHPLYNVWNNIKHRTTNKNYSLYKSYGAKGVKMNKEWYDNFILFYDWCIDNSWEKGLEVDRIDTRGNYSPDNCRLVTKKINAINRINSCLWIINGVEYKSLRSAALSVGVSAMTIRKRAMLDSFNNYKKEMIYVQTNI